MMRDHLRLTAREVVARLEADWAADVRPTTRSIGRRSEWRTC